ncbi:MAG: Hsp20/alpha crystallin family protein [Planctomycetaceae bacterium]|nr:MAG: Hsp20/alpha crystallin family protein [Planctomycetaceae bacterium]
MTQDELSNDRSVIANPSNADETTVEAAAAPDRVLFTPPVDIFDSPEGLVLLADLPGVATKTLELQIQDNRLTLLGRCAAHAPANARVLHREYEEGDFLRSFILSEDVDHERISARLLNGVLEVVLPRVPRGAPRKIEVKSD